MEFKKDDKVIHTVHHMHRNRDGSNTDNLGTYQARVVEIKKKMVRVKFANGVEKDVKSESLSKAE